MLELGVFYRDVDFTLKEYASDISRGRVGKVGSKQIQELGREQRTGKLIQSSPKPQPLVLGKILLRRFSPRMVEGHRGLIWLDGKMRKEASLIGTAGWEDLKTTRLTRLTLFLKQL